MMISNKTSSALAWSCLLTMRVIPWNLSCILCRLGGVIILCISIVCITFNIRFLSSQQRQNSLVFSLFLASFIILVVSVPIVLLQLFTCHCHCSELFCHIEGFTSYLSGNLCMLIFVILSVHRYLLLCSYRQLLSYKMSTFICWFLSLAFTVPLIFNYLNSYIPEGYGFHCGINWRDPTSISRLYIFFSFLVLYFFPLMTLFFVNFRVHIIIHTIYSKHYLNYSFQTHAERVKYFEQIHDSHYYIRQAHDRKRFQVAYRFVRAIIFLVSSYIIAWTPYSIVAILQLFNVKFISEHLFLITLSAMIAKLSVILSPLVYLNIMNYKLFKKILFQ